MRRRPQAEPRAVRDSRVGTFDEVTCRFPSNEFDVLTGVEGNNLLARVDRKGARSVTDLKLTKGTRGIISLFSAREPVLNNVIIRGKLLSENGHWR
jgi:uncharacterized protein